MTQMPHATSMAWPTAPGAGRRDRIRGQSSSTFRQCTTGSAWCATNATTTHQPHQTPSTAMSSRTANPLERDALMSQPHLDNCQQETYRLNLSPLWIWIEKSRGFLASLRLPYWGHPHPLAQPWRRTRWRRHHPPTCNIPSPVFPHV